MIKVLIVDDQIILSESIKFRMNIDSEIEVVACASNGKEAIELCNKFLPDVVLMDIAMPICDGIEATKQIKAKHSSTRVIILTVFVDEENILKAMKNGADGYVLKDVGPEELIGVIKNTSKGLRVIHQDVFDTILNQNLQLKNSDIISLLCERDLEVIKMIVQGKSTREIAAGVYLSEGRVKNIISEILIKLGCKDRVQLAVFAVKNGLI
ncbi:MAG: response regulator transcription factor [Clostridia bacterium]|nr:response regulator transcription factor [Clostridia bacterium]